jgi:predicted O-methyltransferase YrrM
MLLATAGGGVLERIISTGVVETPDGRTIQLHSNVSCDEGEFLQRVIRHVRPRRSLEVGLAYGISTLYICEALAEVGAERHVAIDPYQYEVPAEERVNYSSLTGWHGIGVENVRRAGYAHLLEHVPERSEFALPRMAREGQQFEFAFIDGYHTFEAAFIDFFYVDRMLPVGGVMVFDDLSYPAVRKLVRFIIQNRDYVPLFSPAPSGRVSWKRRLLLPLLRSKLKPEIAIPDSDLGITPQWIALRKNSALPNGDVPGARRWDAHVDF